MRFYKVIYDDGVIDVLKDPVYVKVARNGYIIRCDVDEAAGVVSSDGNDIWHIAGRPELNRDGYPDVALVDITEIEYDELYTLLDLGADIPVDDDPFWEEAAPEEIPNDATLEEVKRRYIEKMSLECQNAIFDGIDVELSNGDIQHFTLEIEDQLNLITMSALVSQGHGYVPYHARDSLCVYYSAADIMTIVSAATAYKTYHTSYFNSLKNWISSMQSIAEIGNIKYGDTIPSEFCSDVLKNLLEIAE